MTGAKKRRYPSKKRLSTPALLPQLLSPIKGTKGTTGRIVIPNLHRRRSGSATVFILHRLLGCVCRRIISTPTVGNSDSLPKWRLPSGLLANPHPSFSPCGEKSTFPRGKASLWVALFFGTVKTVPYGERFGLHCIKEGCTPGCLFYHLL